MLGLIRAVIITAASGQDHDGANTVRPILRHNSSRLRVIWADQAYAGRLRAWGKAWRRYRPVRLAIVKRSGYTGGFAVSPQQRIVERTLGWFNRDRRLQGL